MKNAKNIKASSSSLTNLWIFGLSILIASCFSVLLIFIFANELEL